MKSSNNHQKEDINLPSSAPPFSYLPEISIVISL